MPGDAIIVETSFSTEYSHAIRVVILHAKNILRGNAAAGTAVHPRCIVVPDGVGGPPPDGSMIVVTFSLC